MPNINRIRVNNVKYNFGTQSYDDFSMRMYGKNTLYDLANGGGKSVLMLLLLQNLIPNCTLDDKQPVEKLFRTGGGNTTIHSLIEWRLDDKDIREGFRYMTTGFCARKAKDTEESQRGQMSIEYFNYCIFYRDYNENDIINLPLHNSKERITYSGLKNYLKELSRNNLNLRVHIFERKGEYQRFISRYGLFESQWEIIRGINKTEGHVRTYFETHYKTTRKVVEDLLIEEIIEKAFLVKTEQNDVNEDMAKTLLDIKDKLVELSRKKSEIANFDKETELMQLLEGRVSSFLALYEQKDSVAGTLGDIYVTGEALRKQGETEIAAMEQKQAAYEDRLLHEQKRLEGLKIVKDRYDLNERKQELAGLKEQAAAAEQELAKAKAELDLKESINDYLRYLSSEAQLKENQAMLAAFADANTDQLEKLHRYACVRKQLDDEKLKGMRRRLEEKTKELTQISQKADSQSRILEEGRLALAVAKSHREHFSGEYEKRMEEIRNVRKEISILVLTDLKDLMEALEKEEQELTEKKEQAEASCLSDLQKENETRRALYEEQENLRALKASFADAEKRCQIYKDNEERLNNMCRVYGVKEAEELYDTIKERAFEHRVSMAELEKDMEAVSRHLEQVKEGRILAESEAVTRVKDYLESRHGEFALSGVDYLSALPKANREELLNRFPLLPYGVVTKEFDKISEDERIQTLDLGSQAVPVFDRNSLESPYVPEEPEGVLLLCKDKTIFLEEDSLAMETSRLQKKYDELKEELDRAGELQAVYGDDMEYAVRLTGADFLHVRENMQVLQEDILEQEKKVKQLSEEAERLAAHGKAQREAAAQAEETLAANRTEQKKLAGIRGISDLADETKAQLDFYDGEVRRLQKETDRLQKEQEEAELGREELSSQTAQMQQQIDEVLTDWNTIYKAYYVEGEPVTAVELSEEELKAEFLAAKAVVEQAEIALDDKKKLIAALSESMERDLKMIKRRGVAIEALEQLKKEGELHEAPEEFISRLSAHLSGLSVHCGQVQEEYKKKEHETAKLEGRVEQAVSALKERFGGDAEPDDTVAKEEAVQAIAEGDRILRGMKEELKQFRDEYRKYVKNHEVIIDLYKDVKRIVDSEGIDTKDAKVLMEDQDTIRAVFEDSLLAYDKSTKALARARQEMMNYKTQTANTFFAMGAGALSESVKDDVQIPETYGEAKALLANIREMISYIALEKERVAKGIEDMEAVKNHFENQCIERCRDVRTELEKLPKLSRIQLDGEMIQMINLSIPYVKDEFIKQRMSDYIDEVVKGADSFTDDNDRMKYMKNHLLLKKLFGVMVTDMNAIKLKLYKRERMKEQSRYLRYEEAVGSTGQSQGIYIQFLISIINYISGMYAPGAETDALKKVIFIDNPFGAAKDIYIWEPIFALLKTNNVQLIVPARGATPAITSRFDVNYILGQQMVNGRQQTVVADYRSQVEQDEVEYENLEYSQGTFDFI